MSKVFRILMIDDDKDNFDSLKNKAALKSIVLSYAASLEEMLTQLRSDRQIDAVILDGKGFTKKGQIKGTEKEDFVHEALTELRLLEKEQDRIIPKCVYTAWYDQLKAGLESRIRVFDKKKLALDENLMDELFEYLRNEISRSFSKKVRLKYEEVLSCFGAKYIPSEKEADIIKLLTRVESNVTVYQSDFNIIRDLLECIFKRANIIDHAFIPNDLMKVDGRPNLEWCYRYLSGLQTDVRNTSNVVLISYPPKSSIVPQHVSRSIEYVKQVTSIFSHDYTEKWTALSFKSTILALAEIIIWFKKYIDLKYPNI